MTDTLNRPLQGFGEGPVPPQALDAERAVLSAMLLGPEAIGRAIEKVDSSVFYRAAHAKVFDACVALYGRNEKADLITVVEELRKRGDLEAVGGPAFVASLVEGATTTANLEEHIRIVASKAVLRALIRASQDIQQECYAGADETQSILDRAEQKVFAITDTRVRQGFTPIKELLKNTFKNIQELYERKAYVTGVPSGYDDLDKMTSGFQAGDLIIIAGRPAMGKSSMAVNMAENAAIRHKIPIAIFSLEMSKEQLAFRLLCSQSEVALHKLRSGFLGKEDWPRLTTGAGLLNQAPIMIDDSAAPTVLEIRAKCRRLKAEGKLGMVVIDYLQLVRPSGRNENRVQEISEITRSLKALAKELEVPVIALSQLSRAVDSRTGTDRRPQLSDLRESGCLTGDTRILRADTGAEVTLGRLVASGERNIPVWSLDANLQLVPATMTHAFPSGTKPVFRLKLASGRDVRASANHPFLTLDGWRRLDELEPGVRLAVPRHVPAPRTLQRWPDAHVALLAHMIGDGCMVARQPLHYTSADPANVEAVEQAATAFGVTARRVRQKNWWHVYLRAPYHLTHGRRNPIALWLDQLGLYGLRSYEKFVPDGVFGLSDDQVATFLRHLWATDGCIKTDTHQVRCYYSSTSSRLIEDVRLLLLRFGIASRRKTVRKGGYRPQHFLLVYGKDAQERFLTRVGCHGGRGAEVGRALEFLASKRANTNLDTVPAEVWQDVRIGMSCRGMTTRGLARALETAYCGSTLYRHAPSRQRLERVAVALEDEDLMKLARSGVFWDAVQAIVPDGEEPVYDATVESTHNFVANGIVAHNSIEQDSDLVMFVFREEYYKRDDPALKGKAELIVAKQRNGPTGDVHMTFLHEFTKFVPGSDLMPGETEPGF